MKFKNKSEESKRRDRDALAMRQAGHTYRSIGEKHGISTERARQLVLREETLRRESPSHLATK